VESELHKYIYWALAGAFALGWFLRHNGVPSALISSLGGGKSAKVEVVVTEKDKFLKAVKLASDSLKDADLKAKAAAFVASVEGGPVVVAAS